MKPELYVGEMLMKIVTHQTGDIARTEFIPQKPAFPAKTDQEKALPVSTPEEQGISSRDLLQMLKRLREAPSCRMHKVMMLRNGNIIMNAEFPPFQSEMWHVTHSMCKSITGMAIGLLVSEGELQVTDKIDDIFSERKQLLRSLKSKGVTVEHLLTMTSGVAFNEMGAVSGNSWVKEFLNAGTEFTPGSKFSYNSMNSYMLSAIVTEKTGMTMLDYLKPRLFEPMGIERVFWETSPEGITKGGWGMFMRTEDMAKMGQLYLQKGRWKDQQLIPEEWVEESLKPHVATGEEGSSYYGYQLWLNGEREGAFTFNGMLGQNVYCYPDINAVLVTNAGNNEIFQKGEMSDIIQSTMSSLQVCSRLPEDRLSLLQLQKFGKDRAKDSGLPAIAAGGWGKRNRIQKSVRSSRAREKLCQEKFYGLFEKMNGQEYRMERKGAGIMPLLAQIMHNNFTDGITDIRFCWEASERQLVLQITEGENEYQIPCGRDGHHAYTTLDFHGEIYHLAVGTSFTEDEYGRPVIRNEIDFLEEATRRIMNIHLGEKNPMEFRQKKSYDLPEQVEVRMDETPGSDLLLAALDSIRPDGSWENFMLKRLQNEGLAMTIREAEERAICPVIRGTRVE